MSKDLTERAQRAFKKQIDGETRTIPVPELDEEGQEPVVLYVYPISNAELKAIIKDVSDPVDCAVTTIALRARNDNGNRLFSNIEKDEILRTFPPAVLMRIFSEINKDLKDIMRLRNTDEQTVDGPPISDAELAGK